MKHLLETVYILTPESYVYHRNENVCISIGGEEKASVPASRIESIVFIGKNTCSTSLFGFCGKCGISIVFLDERGRFLSRVCGPVTGNVLLRKKQYEKLGNDEFGKQVVRDILYGKIINSKNVLMRQARNSAEVENLFYVASEQLSTILNP